MDTGIAYCTYNYTLTNYGYRGTQGWTCEEWMDWSECVAPIALAGVQWPKGNHCPIKAAFDDMHMNLRSVVLHYLRGDVKRVGTQATMAARMWAFNYASRTEQVRTPPCLTRMMH